MGGQSRRPRLAILRTAFVSTYAPQRCGIATFTDDLATAVGGREIVALQPVDRPGPYPAEVRHDIRRDVQTDYAAAARALNACGVDAVSIQHEYGIWGGEDGAYVLDFVRALRVPASPRFTRFYESRALRSAGSSPR